MAFAGDLNGNAVFVEILDEYDDNSGLVGVPAIVNGKKATIYIEFEIVGETLNYDVLGALPESFNGAVARLMPINTGDTINPLFQQINADGSTEFVTFTGNNFTVSSAGITIGIGSLDAVHITYYYSHRFFWQRDDRKCGCSDI